MPLALVHNELDVLLHLLPAPGPQVIELGCGSARMAQALLQRCPTLHYLGLEVDARQHARNLEVPRPNMRFEAAGAQAIPSADQVFDLALMLKSLHHVPLECMDTALQEVARVLRPGGYFYVSEPVYAGALNDIVRLYNDEGVVRAAAQAALDRALALPDSPWEQACELRFDMPVHFADFAEFERRMLHPSFADHHITPELTAQVAAAFAPHCPTPGKGDGQGAAFVRPMLVRLLRRR